jgi:hypothetical protein
MATYRMDIVRCSTMYPIACKHLQTGTCVSCCCLDLKGQGRHQKVCGCTCMQPRKCSACIHFGLCVLRSTDQHSWSAPSTDVTLSMPMCSWFTSTRIRTAHTLPMSSSARTNTHPGTATTAGTADQPDTTSNAQHSTQASACCSTFKTCTELQLQATQGNARHTSRHTNSLMRGSYQLTCS